MRYTTNSKEEEVTEAALIFLIEILNQNKICSKCGRALNLLLIQIPPKANLVHVFFISNSIFENFLQ